MTDKQGEVLELAKQTEGYQKAIAEVIENSESAVAQRTGKLSGVDPGVSIQNAVKASDTSRMDSASQGERSF